MSEEGHRYFFGQNPEMPWRIKMEIYVNGKKKEISLRAYRILSKKALLDDDPRKMCSGMVSPDYCCTCVNGHKHPHIAHGTDEDSNPVYAVEVKA